MRAQEAGKPVIVSMGNLAASGGYFVAMDADKIVAQPGTITGSIGVLGGKMLTNGFWDKLGISWDEVASSANSTMFTGTHPYSERGYERFQGWLDRIYEDFTSKVADGRELPLEKVREIAKGRVWTGADALEIGLVDRLGGVHEAMALVREELGLDADAPLRIRRLPAKKTPLQMLLGEEKDRRNTAALETLTRTLEAIQPRARVLGQILEPQQAELSVAPEFVASP